MNIDECMNYIHKTVWLGSKPGLSRIKELLERAGNPQRSLKFVHIVGTNGKGSCSAMLSLALEKSGFKTGMFVSPYITSFNERIQVNGVPVSDEALCRCVEKMKPCADAMEDPPTEFELITAVGFEYFKECGCDIVVLEAGMGGALDSTNIIDTPVVSVFTAIGLDHKEQLGDTVEKIALTKAGILKCGTEAVFNGEEAAALPVIESECAAKGIALTVPDRTRLCVRSSGIFGSCFDYKDYGGLEVALAGIHQIYNAITVVEAAEALSRSGFSIGEDSIRYALANVKWPARFEILSGEPLVIFDGAHNINGIAKLTENVEKYFMPKKPIMLMGVMADKDYGTMLDMVMPLCDRLYTVTPDNPRALDAERLAEEARARGAAAMATELTRDALNSIIGELASDDVLLMMGSLYMYGDIKKLM